MYPGRAMACPTKSSAETSVVDNMLRLRGTNDEDPLEKWIVAVERLLQKRQRR
jgi:hypothetical protein